ncbi:MAG: transglycosylase domain-containing protein [Candidatus Parcubacteria bacterium]|nr:MAG: PBP1A family penicillin-binding protein [Candidatus Parcubacteria bacterium]
MSKIKANNSQTPKMSQRKSSDRQRVYSNQNFKDVSKTKKAPDLSSHQSYKKKPRRNDTPKKTRNRQRVWLKRLIAIGLILLALLVLTGFIVVAWLGRDLPNPNQLITREIAQSTRIYDRSGQHVLYEVHGDEKRTLVSLEEIPDYVEKATIAIEDKNFYEHGGFSIWAIARTMVTNVLYNRSAGGSTLTQQFVKNAVLTNEKSITRKIKELILAQKLEKRFSKDEILQMYLNEIPYGSNAYGVQAASQKYFNKNVGDLTIAEAAVLAALPQSPSRYSPYGPNKDLLLGRKDYILGLMREQGYISESEEDQAKAQEIIFTNPETAIFAPHFVMYVKSLLSDKYGEKTLEQGGLKIITTLDYDKQKIADEVVAEITENYQEKYNANNAALVSLDPKNGQVLAMVGSRDFFNEEISGQVNVVTSPRQPGSSIKPIVYAALFEKGGYNPNTIVFDTVTDFSNYSPKNYNLKEYGPVSLRQALAGSLNISAVKVLYLAGLKSTIALAESLGYQNLSEGVGLSLVLGGAEVRLLDHANAFSALARDGEVSTPSVILKVEDKEGNILEEWKPNKRNILTSETARMVTSILIDNNARSFVFGSKNNLTLSDREVAAKTGTTNDFRDAWTIGYTPSLVTGVWVGNTDNTKMNTGADGSVIAAPIWQKFMTRALEGTPKEVFKQPKIEKTGKAILDGERPIIGELYLDSRTKMPASPNTPEEFLEIKELSDNHSILFYLDKDDPLGPAPENPEKDPQFVKWEEGIKKWAEKNWEFMSTSEQPLPPPLIEIISSSTPPDLEDTDFSTSTEIISTSTIIFPLDNIIIEE